jgi:hypothetical protein
MVLISSRVLRMLITRSSGVGGMKRRAYRYFAATRTARHETRDDTLRVT